MRIVRSYAVEGRKGRNTSVSKCVVAGHEDIGDTEVLARLASELQLDADALRRALDGGKFEAGVLADEREAEELGVSGVPAFIASSITGRRAALSGVQSVTTLRALINRVSPTR